MQQNSADKEIERCPRRFRQYGREARLADGADLSSHQGCVKSGEQVRQQMSAGPARREDFVSMAAKPGLPMART